MRSTGRERFFRGGWNTLEPGYLCILVDGTTWDGLPVYDVVQARGLNSLGESPGGLTVIWAVSSPYPPYKADPKASILSLGAGQQTGLIAPDAFQLQVNEMVQARFKLRLIDTAAGSGAKIDNFDLVAYLPGSSLYWGTTQTTAPLNARYQVPDPADAISAPVQDANMSLPAAFPVDDGFLFAETTEMFWQYDIIPQFRLQWNGASATPAGIAVALEVQGYDYILRRRAGSTQGRSAIVGGVNISIPDGVSQDDIIPVPVQALAGSAARGQ
jgi:hypothetical protein